jgi:hypothetical protein
MRCLNEQEENNRRKPSKVGKYLAGKVYPCRVFNRRNDPLRAHITASKSTA